MVSGPDDADSFKEYFKAHDLRFIGLADPGHAVANRYGQEVKLFKLGCMPAEFLIDRAGLIKYAHYGESMSDIPDNNEILLLVDQLSQ